MKVHGKHSTAQHSTAQHSTAQHSTAHHSTPHHSTAYSRNSVKKFLEEKVKAENLPNVFGVASRKFLCG